MVLLGASCRTEKTLLVGGGMQIQEQLNRQRVKHIISSYHLQDDDEKSFWLAIEQLLRQYPAPLIELAIVETLVVSWLTIPLVRGLTFLKQVQQQLYQWESDPITSRVTPEQFQQITGLDASPICGPSRPPQFPAHPV